MQQESMYIHTDLAMELQEEMERRNGMCGRETERSSGNGITVRKGKKGKLKEIIITVENEEGERLLGKPRGVYITLESEDLADNDGEYHEEMSVLLAKHLEKLLGKHRNVLVAGLGNREVTPDALGPLAVQNLFITNPLRDREGLKRMRLSTAVAPGVMAQTGMETGEILRGIIDRTRPEVMIVIDALAAKNPARLTKTIQICDTGIAPGAGVGNGRREISRSTMGIPVIAVGVPTVISIPAVAGDILSAILPFAVEGKHDPAPFSEWSEQEQYQFLAAHLPEDLFGLFVTPKEIDESVKRISYTISEGINRMIAGAVDTLCR